MTNPVPTEATLSEFYRDHYREFYRKVRAPTPEHIREYGLDQRAFHTSGYLEEAGLLQDVRSVLDVGCAEGSLLQAIGRRVPGVQLHGVEPNPDFGQYARATSGARIVPSLEDFEASGIRVDLITVNHVLEHVREPAPFLRRLSAMLSESGRIYVDVPDAARYVNIDDLHIAHLYHFTRASLRNIGGIAGLTCQRAEAHAPFRHPLSVRAVFAPGASADWVAEPDPDAVVAKARILRIARLAPLQHFRRSRLGLALFGVPMIGIRYLRGLAAGRV